MAAHPGAAVLLLVGLWYLIRDPEVRNMVTFATIEEEVEESGAAAEPEAEASTEEHANDSSQAHADKVRHSPKMILHMLCRVHIKRGRARSLQHWSTRGVKSFTVFGNLISCKAVYV